MRDVNGTLQDREYLEEGLRAVLKAAIAEAVQARGLPETRAAAERERDRLKELLDAVRDPGVVVIRLPPRPRPVEGP